jgi:hypothetical protein
MKLALVALAVAAALYGLHRAALWLEARGHLYYLHRQPSGSALGNAALEIQSILEPGKKIVVEERRAIRSEKRQSGDPPDPSGRIASPPHADRSEPHDGDGPPPREDGDAS